MVILIEFLQVAPAMTFVTFFCKKKKMAKNTSECPKMYVNHI